MRKVNGYHTETFEYEMGFMIDLVITPDCYYAWLYFKTCGIKMMMFGLPIESVNYNEAIEIIKANLKEQNFIPIYIDNYMTDGVDK